MKSAIHLLMFTTVFGSLVVALETEASAQYPVVVAPQPVVPVYGYTAERRGLFGQRTVFRPVVVGAVPVAPVVSVASTTVVQSPVVPATAIQPAITVARPILPAPPVTVRYSPVVAPATVYYPRAPVWVPTIRSYRVPVVFGF